jgi:hypothetical protein
MGSAGRMLRFAPNLAAAAERGQERLKMKSARRISARFGILPAAG